MKYVLGISGYQSMEADNQKKIQELNTANSGEMSQMHQRMDEVAQQQSDFLNAAQDQQRINQQREEDQMQMMRDQHH